MAYNETPPSMKGTTMNINFNARPAVAAVVSTLNIKDTIRRNRVAREAEVQSNIHAQAMLASHHIAGRASELGLFEGKSEEQILAWMDAEYHAQVDLLTQN